MLTNVTRISVYGFLQNIEPPLLARGRQIKMKQKKTTISKTEQKSTDLASLVPYQVPSRSQFLILAHKMWLK